MQETNAGTIPRLDWFDYARLFCALAVMFDHYMVIALDPRISKGIASYGMATEIARYATIGLFVFLMMSGLVITLVAQRQTAATFLAHRFARVYPTFIVCMTITAILSHFGPEQLHVSLPQYIANLAMNAPAFGYRFTDAVYWTLIIEMAFYGMVLVALVTGAIRHLQLLVTLWVAAMVVCVPLPWRLPLVGYDYYFIAAGCVMGLLYQRRNQPLNYVLLGVTLLLCLRTSFRYATSFHFDPWVAMGMTVAIFAIFLLMRGRNVKLPFAKRLGSMTYSLYLLHFKIGMVVLALTVTEANKWWVVAGLAAGMIAFAFAFDEIMEYRLRPFWLKIARATVAKPFEWWEARKAATSSA